MTLDRASAVQKDKEALKRKKKLPQSREQEPRVPHVCLSAFTEAHGRVNPHKTAAGRRKSKEDGADGRRTNL